MWFTAAYDSIFGLKWLMMALKQRREIFRGLKNSLEMQQKFPTSLSRCTWSQSCKKFLPHLRVLFALPKAGSLMRSMQILNTSSREIASTGTVLHMCAFVPADTGLCLLLWQEELLGAGCKLLCVPGEWQQTWPSLPHSAQGTAAPQCHLTFCGTLLPDMMKLMVYCFGFSLSLKYCSWLFIHHCNH